jgi:hypothetical protein
MTQLENQGLIQRFSHQGVHKDRIEAFNKSLDNAYESFNVSFITETLVPETNLQMSVNHPHTGTAHHLANTVEDVKELDSIIRQPRGVVDVSLLSDKEWEVSI